MWYYNVIHVIIAVAYSDCNLYETRDGDSVGVIHMAAKAGDIRCVQERITAGDDPNLKTAQGSSVLHFAYQGKDSQDLVYNTGGYMFDTFVILNHV